MCSVQTSVCLWTNKPKHKRVTIRSKYMQGKLQTLEGNYHSLGNYRSSVTSYLHFLNPQVYKGDLSVTVSHAVRVDILDISWTTKKSLVFSDRCQLLKRYRIDRTAAQHTSTDETTAIGKVRYVTFISKILQTMLNKQSVCVMMFSGGS